MRKIKTISSGFTLIEAVVATAIFAFVISSIVGVYISTIQLDRKTRSLRAVAQNARFITEFLAKEVRNGSINYASYPSGLVPANNSDLYVLNQAGELEHIYPSAATCTPSAPCDLLMTKNAQTSNLNTQTVKITNFKFYVSPTGDPYAASSTYSDQPRVTMVMELSSIGQTVSDSAKVDLETTFGSRAYPAVVGSLTGVCTDPAATNYKGSLPCTYGPPPPPPPQATWQCTGGACGSSSGVWDFSANPVFSLTTTGTYSVTFNQAMNLQYLVVAGGGGGWYGGGGAGGLKTSTGFAVLAQAYSVIVGVGGMPASNGSDSVFSTITSTGGGAGASPSPAIGGNGGSGGGAGQTGGSPGNGIAGQGNNGGAATGCNAGGGGGGAGAVGGDCNSSVNTGGNGGAGVANSTSGSSVIYSGGGGGASNAQAGGNGGAGGGGNGATGAATGTNGTANTGGGGGGSWGGTAGSGGSGIVILKYLP